MNRVRPFAASVCVMLAVLAGCRDAGTPTVREVVPGLTLQLPQGWKMSAKDGTTTLKPAVAHCHIQLWPVADVSAPADALPKVASLIQGEVLDFKVSATNDVAIAGTPAKHLVGAGVEADDNDVSKVEVFLFSTGNRVYLLCAHTGEDDPAKQRDEIIGVLNTAKAK